MLTLTPLADMFGRRKHTMLSHEPTCMIRERMATKENENQAKVDTVITKYFILSNCTILINYYKNLKVLIIRYILILEIGLVSNINNITNYYLLPTFYYLNVFRHKLTQTLVDKSFIIDIFCV